MLVIKVDIKNKVKQNKAHEQSVQYDDSEETSNLRKNTRFRRRPIYLNDLHLCDKENLLAGLSVGQLVSEIYSVIKFQDGIPLVPTSWIRNDNRCRFCEWPAFNSQSTINKAIINLTTPDKSSNWTKHKILRIFCSAESYQSGREKLRLAETILDIDSSDKEIIKNSRHASMQEESARLIQMYMIVDTPTQNA
ncbi:hypothetical protein RN001_002833 [Aquatica leii]|uniref:Uncharacterized protein n=1 Tax=Aquatica leii TaxID=1421715 RepID=A0AAN7SKE0_9COLE|nr:hypothetical protein RN001_002833 [Aquatica leii]